MNDFQPLYDKCTHPEQKEALTKLEKELDFVTSTPHGRRTFLASLPALMACAEVERTRYREGDNTGQASGLSVEQEKQMTAEYLPQLKKEFPLTRSATAQQYVSDLGNKIVRANGLVGKPYNYRFSLVDSKQVNAFALPAGEIMVTTPLLALADSEAELAGVIGHEVGHVIARHSAERMATAKKTQNKGLLYGLGGALLGGAAGFAIGKIACKRSSADYRACMQRVSKYGVMAGGMGGLMIQKFGFMANSREDEMEADRIGFKTSLKAGFHKDHVGGFYNKLLQMEQARKSQNAGANSPLAIFADALSTHPPSIERVRQMQEMSSQSSLATGKTISSTQFERVRAMFKQS